jgi:hypothetical protein
MLPPQWIQTQLDFRLRALEQMFDGRSLVTAQLFEAFHSLSLHPSRLDDLPHWRQLNLTPNLAYIDLNSV